jgi:HEAT repeat protein
VRHSASLGQLGDPRALKFVVHAMDDECSEVRRTAVKALGQLGGLRAIEPLIGALADADAGSCALFALPLRPYLVGE